MIQYLFKPNSQRDQYNRQAILKLVYNNWIRVVLEKSLYTKVLLDLDLEERIEAIEYPFDVVVQVPGQENYLLPQDTKLIDVFIEMNQALLILGEPGSGKTTMLLALTRALLIKAEADQNHPIPVVFNLASWARDQKPLTQWLTDELQLRYNTPRVVAQQWIANRSLLLLLDGLDEVIEIKRDACIQAINDFYQAYQSPLAVCSRVRDYEVLDSRLKLGGAVFILALTQHQIDTYLSGLGKHRDAYLIRLGKRRQQTEDSLNRVFSDEELRCWLYDQPEFSLVYQKLTPRLDKRKVIRLLLDYVGEEDQLEPLLSLIKARDITAYQQIGLDEVDRLQVVRDLLERDKTLAKLARSPLMLSIMVLTYQGKLVTELDRSETETDHQRHLFDTYINVMFERRGKGDFSSKESKRWLGWLAYQMVQHNQTVFALEGLQPSWGIPSPRLIFGLIYGLSFGLIDGLIYGLVIGLSSGSSIGLRDGLILGLVGGLIFGLFGGRGEQNTEVEILKRSWQKMKSNLMGVRVFGLIDELIFGLFSGQEEQNTEVIEVLEWSWQKMKSNLIRGLSDGLIFGLIIGLMLMIIGELNSGLSVGQNYGRIGALIFELIFGLNLGLIFGLIYGVIGGLRVKEIITQRTEPNQGIRQAAKSALKYGGIGGVMSGVMSGVIGGLIFGVIFGAIYGLIFGVIGGLFSGQILGLISGGETVIKHYVLRYVFARQNYTPPIKQYIPFLEFAVNRHLLYRVGGSYIFIHRLLMEQFAKMWEEKNI